MKDFMVPAVVIALGAAGAFGCSFETQRGVPPDPAPDAGSGGDGDGGDDVIVGTKVTIRTVTNYYTVDDGPTANAQVVAFRDGGGPWRALRGRNGVYVAGSVTGRYAVVAACDWGTDDNPYNVVHVFYESIADTTELHAPGCPSAASLTPTVRITVDVHGLAPGELANVAVGTEQARITAGGTRAQFTVPRGVSAAVFAGSIDAMLLTPGRIARGPTLMALEDQTLSFDLAAVGAPPDSIPVMVGGLRPSESVNVVSSYSAPALPIAWYLGSGIAPSPYVYRAVPAAARQPGDLSDVEVIANDNMIGDRIFQRYDRQAMAPGAVALIDLPTPWLAPVPVFEPARQRALITLPIAPSRLGAVDYQVQLHAAVVSPGHRADHYWTLHIGSGWLPQRPDALVTTPDLSELPEWTARKAFPFGADVRWVITRLDHAGPLRLAPALGRRVLGNLVVSP